MTMNLAVKRITVAEAIEHIHRDGQDAYSYMAKRKAKARGE